MNKPSDRIFLFRPEKVRTLSLMSPSSRTTHRLLRLLSSLLLAAGVISAFPLFARAETTTFPRLSVAPEVGYRFFGAGTLDNRFDARIDARHGAMAKGHVTAAFNRFSVDIAPSFNRQLSGGLVGDLSAFGGEASVRYGMERGTLFPTAGLGFHGAYIFPTETAAGGCELYGRAALGLTWIFFPHLGITAETAFLAGATGIRFKDGPGIQHMLYERMRFAFTVGAALSVGIRFP